MKSFAWFLLLATVVTLVIAGSGSLIVARWTQGGVGSWLSGCAASWMGSCIGAILPARAGSARGAEAVHTMLGATALRLFVVAALAVGLVLSGRFHPTVLVAAVSTSYLFLLVVDSVYLIRRLQGRTRPAGGSA